MSISGLVSFVFVVYLGYIVTISMINNYNSNKEIMKSEEKLTLLEEEIATLQDKINYYQTNSFKEKEARAKLGYKAPGESVLVMPIDTQDEKITDSSEIEIELKSPNYTLWWEYFFKSKKIVP